jgi:hypothetical protein
MGFLFGEWDEMLYALSIDFQEQTISSANWDVICFTSYYSPANKHFYISGFGTGGLNALYE